MHYVRHFLCCECSLGSHRAEFGSRWWCKSPAVICQKHSVTISALIHFTFPDFCQSIHEIKRGLRTREMRHRALVTAFSAINASFFARNYLMGNRWKTQISGQCDGNFSKRLVKAAQTSETNTKNMVIYTHTHLRHASLFGIQDQWLSGTKPQTPAAVGLWHSIL